MSGVSSCVCVSVCIQYVSAGARVCVCVASFV